MRAALLATLAILVLLCATVVRAEPCEMIDDPAGYRYLECSRQGRSTEETRLRSVGRGVQGEHGCRERQHREGTSGRQGEI